MGRTLVEKILRAHVDDPDEVEPGRIVMVRCDLVMANDISGPIAFRTMQRMGAERVFDAKRVVIIPDHFVPAKDERSARLQKLLRDWSRDQGVFFYEQGRGGIEHTVLVEDGWVWPGAVVAGGDSHTCTLGALGAFGTGLGSTDVAACLATGMFWQTVPGTIQVVLTGEKRPLVTGKDVILAVLAQLGAAGGTNHVLEFVGPGARALSVDERLAAANMAVEAGSETGLFPADEVTAEYLVGRVEGEWQADQSDPDAEVAQRLRVDLDETPPLVALPHSPANVVPVAEATGQRVDQVYIGNCGNGTMTDLRQAADVLRGRRLAAGVRAVVVPATQRVYREALAEGLLDVFAAAGAMVSTPTCGACFGGGMGILAAGETAVATTNRNFRGRMGSNAASVYLANAWVAAAAAVAGEIVDPADVLEGVPA